MVEERRNRLLEFVRQRRFASLPELVEEMQVSESTIRRDLEQLEEQDSVKRIHGGVLYAGSSPRLPHFASRAPARWGQKRALARCAAEMMENGATVLLDGGSTTFEVARLLVGRALHVVTTSLPVANLFASDAGSDLVVIGGNICPRSGVAQGPIAEDMISRLRVGKTVLSVAGISEEGFFNNNLLLVETERAMMKAADQVIVVADSSKFGRQSLAHLCELGAPDRLVVDDEVTEAWKLRMAAELDLVIAPVATELKTD